MSRILLVRGVEYVFNLSDREHDFILSTDSTGGTLTGIITNGVTIEWEFYDGSVWSGDVHYYLDKPYAGATHAIDPDSERVYKSKISYTPNAATPDTIYCQCSEHVNEGVTIYVSTVEGTTLNEYEWYYLLGINQSNRLSYVNSDPTLIDSFLSERLPAGVRVKRYNKAAAVTALGDTTSWHHPISAEIVSLSGLISDIENDILTYTWAQTAPLATILTLSGLSSPITSGNSINMTAALSIPPVSTLYDFRITVDDTYNASRNTIQVKVSGLQHFDNWTYTSFAMGDCRLPFSELP